MNFGIMILRIKRVLERHCGQSCINIPVWSQCLSKRSFNSKAFAKTRSAFTLLEVVVAMAISAFVMVGAVVLMFNTSVIVRHFEEGEPFDLHVNGVESFLLYSFRNAAFPEGMDASLVGVSAVRVAPVVWGMPPDSFLNERRKLCFGVLDDRPFFISRRAFSPEKICWLAFREEEGLFLIWRFVKSENYYDHDEIPVYESVISNFVTSFEYVYIDANGNWNYETDSENMPTGVEDGTMPNFIRIVFKYGDEKFERLIPLATTIDKTFEPSPASAASSSQGGGGGRGQSGGQGGGAQGGGNQGGQGGQGNRPGGGQGQGGGQGFQGNRPGGGGQNGGQGGGRPSGGGNRGNRGGGGGSGI